MSLNRYVLLSVFISLCYCKQISPSDIKIYLYTKNNQDPGTIVNISDAADIAKTEFSPAKDTIFFIHGWMDKDSSSSCKIMRKTYLQKYDVNMFIVDWSKIADNILYPVAFDKVEPMGKLLGEMIVSLIENSKLSLEKTVFVGHSLGAHIAGVWGRQLNGEVDHIVGLDPAGPLFTSKNTENRLTTSSAKFVHVIHTCGGLLGYFDQIGHADYYPNGGHKQPTCGLDPFGQCSHLKSLDYYAESLLTGNFKAKKCANYKDYENGKCDATEVSNMGEYIVDRSATGTYFLETNNKPPYAKN